MAKICVFEHCFNSTYTLSRWSRLTCLKHLCKRTDGASQCPSQFTLHTFPIEKRDMAARLKWAKAIYRKRTYGKKTSSIPRWQNFIDGKPTAAYPYPTQNLGLNVAPQFSRKPPKLRQEPVQQNIHASKRMEDVSPMPTNNQQPQHNDHSYVLVSNLSPACQCVGYNSQ